VISRFVNLMFGIFLDYRKLGLGKNSDVIGKIGILEFSHG